MLEFFNRAVDAWFSWHAAMLWQVSLLIVLLWLIDRLIRRWAWPQLRYALWLLVLLKLLIPPTFSLPTSARSLLPFVAHNQVNLSVDAITPPAEVAEATPPQERDEDEEKQVNPALNISLEAVAPPPPSVFPTEVTEPEPNAKWTWKGSLFVVWLTGVASLLIALIVRVRQVRIIYALSDPEEIPDWFHGLVARAAEELDLRATPRVVLTDKMGCPAVLGLWRPILLMPIHQVNTLQREDVHHMLLHELAHIKRADLWVHALATLLTILYWFNPLIWFIRRPMENLRELCCDATVASLLREQTAAYRETLLARAREMLASPADPGLGLLGLMEDTNWLSTRLRSLDRPLWRHRLKRGMCAAVILLVMCCCVLPMAARPVIPKEEPALTDDEPYRVTLPSGVTIEVVALREIHDEYITWWLPDGTPLDEPLYDDPYVGANRWGHGDNVRRIEISLRYSDLPPGAKGRVRYSELSASQSGNPVGIIPSDGHTGVDEHPDPFQGFFRAAISASADDEMIDLVVKLASSPWTDYFGSGPTSFQRWGNPGGGVYAGSANIGVPYEQEGAMYVHISHRLGDVDRRVVALDIDNVEHTSEEDLGPISASLIHLAQYTSRFSLSVKDVAVIKIQCRPFETVAFNNISLIPGKRPKVPPNKSISFSSMPPKMRHEPDPAEWRELWYDKLISLHGHVIEYMGIRTGISPPKLSDLSISPLVERYFPFRNIVSDLSYFSGPAFTFLTPEMFDTGQSGPLPIAWVKTLQQFDEFNGTYVWYSDGRVEWVTPEELADLKSRFLQY